MKRSGMKRGLAVSAVSALAVTGITLGVTGPASAIGGVDFQTQLNTSTGSVQWDGVNNSIQLQATGPGAAAKMEFAYSTNGGGSYTDIASVTPVAGLTGTKVFTAEFTPPAVAYNTTVLVRARAMSTVNTPILGSVDVQAIDVSSTDRAVSITNPQASEVGVYQRPGNARVNGIISGYTSDVVGGASVDVDRVAGGSPDTAADYFGPVAGGARPYSGVVDFAGAPVDTGYTVARATDDSDSVAAVRLYTQTIGAGTSFEVNRELIPAGETATATITVRDQKGNPVAGARVVREDDGSDRITNSRGQAVFNGLTPTPAGTTYRFFVDTNVDGIYQAADEYARTFTISSYVATAATIGATSDLGTAWDREEVAGVTIRVGDQHDQGFAPQSVQYEWSVVPTAGGAPITYPRETASVAAAGPNKGKVNIGDVPSNVEGVWTLKSWIESNGNPGLNGDAISETKEFKVGQATVKWDDGNVAQNPIGTVGRVYTGVLSLADGTVLANRNFSVFLLDQNGSENAVMAAQADQPAGTTRAPVFPTGDVQVIVETDAQGKFGVAVSDPSGTAGTIEARSLNAAFGTFGPAKKLEIDFMDTVVGDIELGVGSPVNIGGFTKTPGRPVNVGTVKVENQYGQMLTDVPVKIEVDGGYLTPYGADADSLTPAAPKAAGELVGEWKSLGQSVEGPNLVSADGPAMGGAGRGEVSDKVASAVSKDTGFDDDGELDIKIVASAAGKMADRTNTFSSSNPLNPGEVKLTFAANNESRILPKAATTTDGGLNEMDVNIDLVVTDQFGNRTDEPVSLSDDSTSANHTSSANGQYVGEPHSIEAWTPWGNAASDQTVKGTWVNPKRNTWKLNTPPAPAASFFTADTATGPNATGDAPTINWYAVDLAASKYTMTHSGSNHAPGDSVTETYTAKDQNDQPLKGYHTELFRTGPDKLQNGDAKTSVISNTTNADGKSFYTFQGTEAGKAILAGVLFDGNDAAPVEASRINDTVTFAAPVVITPGDNPVKISGKLTATNGGVGNDILRVRAPKAAAGATVSFFKFVKGKKVLVATRRLNNNGKAVATIKDRFKKRVTYYAATVGATAKTKADLTNRARTK